MRVQVESESVEVDERGYVFWREACIGRGWKGTRTYSPPVRKGSRVAKYHKQVPCWWCKANIRGVVRDWSGNTRREVIQKLIEESKA
jgi:hypothetical protein